MAIHTKSHSLGSSDDHSTTTLAELNALISDGSVGGGYGTINYVTTNQSPATTDSGEMFLFTTATSENKTITLPSVGESDDGTYFWINNNSSYVITVQPADSDSIWNNGPGYGIVMEAKTLVCLRYVHTLTKWIALHKSGNKIYLEGLKASLQMNTIDGGDITPDLAERHLAGCDTLFASSNFKFPPSSLYFGNSASEIVIDDTLVNDFNIYSSTSTDVTLEMWVKFTNATGLDWLCSFWEDSDNNFAILRPTSSTAIQVAYESGATTYVSMSGGTCGASTWYHIVLAKIGEESGLYINGQQVAYDATFTTDTLTGSFRIGSIGTDSGNMDGYIDSFTLIYSNYYNLAPNSTPDDSISGWNEKTRIIPIM